MKSKDTSEIQVQFGKRLHQMRKSKKLTLRELSYRCDVDHSFISKLEKGQFNVQLSTIVELAKGLGVDPKELLDFKSHEI